MSRESHCQALCRLLERSLGTAHSEAFKDKLVNEIFHINKCFNYSPSLDEAFTSGDESYKP